MTASITWMMPDVVRVSVDTKRAVIRADIYQSLENQNPTQHDFNSQADEVRLGIGLIKHDRE
jgi:hypothetical protein